MWISTRSMFTGFFARGSTIVRTPRLYVAFAASTSMSAVERDLAREPPVVDLHLLVDTPRAPRAPALSGEDERSLVGEDLDFLGVDAG